MCRARPREANHIPDFTCAASAPLTHRPPSRRSSSTSARPARRHVALTPCERGLCLRTRGGAVESVSVSPSVSVRAAAAAAAATWRPLKKHPKSEGALDGGGGGGGGGYLPLTAA